jgi:hypothetical protein
MLSFGAFAFAAPWILLGLLSLPVIWWLLRITPPAPRLVRFPAIRLLFRLPEKEDTPVHTPLWLLALRLLTAALVIIALAHPLHNPTAGAARSGPILLVIDNGWAAAQNWQARIGYLADLLDRAERERRNLIVLATAPTASGAAPAPTKLLRAAQARQVVQAIRPLPWRSEPKTAAAAIATLTLKDAAVVWLNDGLESAGAKTLAAALAKVGPVTLVTDQAGALPLLLRPPKAQGGKLVTRIERAGSTGVRLVRIRALDDKGVVLANVPAQIPDGKRAADAVIELPAELRNRVVRLDLAGQRTAAAVVLVDERWRRRPVGIVAQRTIASGQPLLSELYYLERALAPYAELRRGPTKALLERPIAVMILPDGATISADDRLRLVKWVQAGGLLLRFAGANLAEGDDALVPVKLRRGDRSVGGAMTWAKPLGLAEFAAGSPFAGLSVPADVRVNRQVLAEPAAELAAKTWARLSDGTPLVTAERRGKGWLALIHTSANPEWSNLALSGLFVQMLRRMVALSQGIAGADASVNLPPRRTLDGFGRPVRPPATALAIAASAFAKTRPGPRHPPGLYGTETIRRSLNLAPSIAALRALASVPQGATRSFYADARQTDFKPWLLAAALLLLIVDTVIGLAMRGLLPLPGRAAAVGAATTVGAAALVLPLLFAAPEARAQGGSIDDQFAIKATSKTRLAYIKTGNAETDQVSLAAMRGLGAILRRRTSVEPGDPMAIDPESDELSLFPMLYWPIVPGQTPPSEQAAARLNHFMRGGGILLIDLRDPGGSGSFDTIALRRALGGVRIPPLAPVPRDHVLTKSFYLLQQFPGRWAGGTVWVQRGKRKVNDGVSQVVVGSNDWAGAWAVDAALRPMFPVNPGGSLQREHAFRTGINIVMYALTGNYKADQVHLPTIMRRLGQ